MTKVEGDKEVTGETITNSIGNSGSAVTMNDDLDVNTNNISNATTIETDTLQVNPQTPAPSINNSLWVDSGDSNKLKHRDNGGTSYEVVDFSHVGTAANEIVQLNGSAQLPALDGSLLTGISSPASEATLSATHFSRIENLRLLDNATLSVLGDEPHDNARDLFIDTTGFLDSINLSNTDATFLTKGYGAKFTDGTPETDPTAADNNLDTSWITTCLAISDGYLSEFEGFISTSSNITVTIRVGTEIVAYKQYTPPGGQNYTYSLAKSDYLRMIKAGETFAVSISSSNQYTVSGESFSGTHFSYSGQQTVTRQSGGGSLTYTPVTGAVGVVETNVLFGTGSNITQIFVEGMKDDDGSNLITYDASVDNGATFTTGLSLGVLNTITSTAGNQVIIRFKIPNDIDALLHGYSLEVKR